MPQLIDLRKNLYFHIFIGNMVLKVVRFTRVLPDPTWQVPSHAHRNFEFHYIPEGHGFIDLEGHMVEVARGDFYLAAPHIRHTQRADPTNPMGEYCLECSIEFLDQPVQNFAYSAEENRLLLECLKKTHLKSYRDTCDLGRDFSEIMREEQERMPGFYLRLQTLLAGVVVKLLRMMLEEDLQRAEYRTPAREMEYIRMQEIKEYVEINMKEQITAEKLAKLMFISRRQVDRIMLKYFNNTFHGYVEELRLNTALNLLRETNMEIKDIAEETGFSSYQQMYQVFRRAGYNSPSDVRENHQ